MVLTIMPGTSSLHVDKMCEVSFKTHQEPERPAHTCDIICRHTNGQMTQVTSMLFAGV